MSWRSFLGCLLMATALPAIAAPIAIHGRIVDEDREPVAGAEVRLVPALGRYILAREALAGTFEPEAEAKTASDRQGRFTLAAPTAGLWRVWIDAEGTVPLEAWLEPLIEEIELPVAEVTPAIVVEVRVRGEGSRPLAGARVNASLRGRHRGLWRLRKWRGLTDAGGKARVPGGRDQRMVFDAFHPGYLPVRREVSGKGAVTIPLERGRQRLIEGRDPRGRRLAGVVARVGKGRLAAGVTGDDGRLTLVIPSVTRSPGVPSPGAPSLDGPTRTRATTPEPRAPAAELIAFDLLNPAFRPLHSHLTASDAARRRRADQPEEPLVFELAPPVSIHGQVIDDATREPLAEILVWVSGRPETQVKTDRSGGFRLPNVGAGTIELRAAAPGYLPASSKVAASNSASTVNLVPSSAMLGWVVDEHGDPVAGVEIEAVSRPLSMPSRRQLDHHTARSDAAGRFRLRSLVPAIRYQLTASMPGYAAREQSFAAPARRQTGKIPTCPPPGEPEVVLLRGRNGSGLVVDGQDQPVAGAEVTLERQAGGDSMDLWMNAWLDSGPDHRVASDAEGRFAIADLGAGRYVLTIRGTGFAAATVPGVEVPEGAGEVDLGTVALSPGADVEGRVIDALGMPLGDVEIRFSSRGQGIGIDRRRNEPVMSRADGTFRIADRRAGIKVHLTAAKAGYVDVTVPGVEAPNREPVVITLQPATRVSGRVIDADSEPISGARLSLRVETAMPSAGDARSADQGRFHIEGVGPGPGQLHVYAEGWQRPPPIALEIPPDGVEDLEITLRRGSAVVLGTVLDAQGSPAPDATVSVMVRAGSERQGHSGETADDGTFRIDGLDPGPGNLTVQHPEHPRLTKTLEVEPGENRLELQLAAGLSVSGQVVAEEGGPVPAATVRLAGEGPRVEGREAVTGADGTFELTGLADGSYTLDARHPDYAPARLDDEVVVAGQAVRGLVLRLEPGAVISGRLLGLEFDELSALDIHAMSETDYRIGEVDFESRYRISRVSPGKWHIEATTVGGRQGRGVVTVAPGERDVALDLELKLARTLSGRILAHDQPVTGAYVSLRGTDVAVIAGAQSDYLGRYEVTGLEIGHYRLEVNARAAGGRLYREIQIEGDETLDLELEMTRVAGRVVHAADRSPIEGVQLQVEPLWDDGADSSIFRGGAQKKSDASGRFNLGELAAGRWRLSATMKGYASAETVLTIFAGEDQATCSVCLPSGELELVLHPTAGLSFTVSHSLGPDLAYVQVAVVGPDGRSVEFGNYPIEAEGRVHLPSVPAGSWELLVGASGMATVSLPVTAPDDHPRIALERGSGLAISVPELIEDKVMARAEIRRPDGGLFRALSWQSVSSVFPLRFGEATLQGLSAGTWQVTVTTADERTWSATVAIPPGVTESVRLE